MGTVIIGVTDIPYQTILEPKLLEVMISSNSDDGNTQAQNIVICSELCDTLVFWERLLGYAKSKT